MILVVLAEGDAVGPALVASLDRVRTLPAGDLGDPLAFIDALRGVERMFLPATDPEHEQNALAAAEQMGAYHVVKVGSDVGLGNTSLRWTVLLPEEGADPGEVTSLALRALTEEGHENATYVVSGSGASP